MAIPIKNHIDMSGNKVTGAADGTAATDYVTKQQLDAVVNGFDYKGSVRVATTGNITLSGTQTIDGVAVNAGERVLVKNQTAGAENGIYVASAGAWTRATDADSNNEFTPGVVIPVEEGTTNGDTLWLHATNGAVTVGTTALTFVKIGPTATGGLTKTTFTVGDGVATALTLTHNLNTQDVLVSVRQAADDVEVLCEVDHDTANTVVLRFASAPASSSLKAVVIG